MSTKIYEAFRCPASRLNDFIDLFREHSLKFTVRFVKGVMSSVKPEVVAEILKEHKYWNDERARFGKVMEWCKEDSRRPEKGFFQLDCGLNIWLYNGKAYIIPICNLKGLLTKFKIPNFAEDYSYWNNTDAPKNISYEAFKRRGATWEKVNCGEGKADHNSRRLYYSVIDFSRFSTYVDEFMLEQRCCPQKKRKA